MTWDLISCYKVWNCCPETYDKFRVVILFSFGDILGNRVGGGRFPPPQRARVNSMSSLWDRYRKNELKPNERIGMLSDVMSW